MHEQPCWCVECAKERRLDRALLKMKVDAALRQTKALTDQVERMTRSTSHSTTHIDPPRSKSRKLSPEAEWIKGHDRGEKA